MVRVAVEPLPRPELSEPVSRETGAVEPARAAELSRKNTPIGRLRPSPAGAVGINAPSPRPSARRFSLIAIDLFCCTHDRSEVPARAGYLLGTVERTTLRDLGGSACSVPGRASRTAVGQLACSFEVGQG